MRGVHLLGLLIVVGVQIDLADVREDSHQRSGIAGAETAGRGSDVLADIFRHHHLAAGVAREVDHRALAGENTAMRKRNRGGEACAAGNLQSAIAGLDHVGGALPAIGARAIFRAAGRRCGGSWWAGLRSTMVPLAMAGPFTGTMRAL